MDDKRILALKVAVEAGGGEWVGIQETVEPPALVLFNSPHSRSTLALYEDLVTEEKVRQKINRADKAHASSKVVMTRDAYERLVVHLRWCLEILAKESK